MSVDYSIQYRLNPLSPLSFFQSQRQANFWKAAIAGNLERLRALIDAGVDVDGMNEYGQTAVYLAVLHGREEAVGSSCPKCKTGYLYLMDMKEVLGSWVVAGW